MDAIQQGNPEYQLGIIDFVKFVIEHGDGSQLHLCPCRFCRNMKAMSIKDMYDHLNQKGIMRSYNIWTKHGEVADHNPSLEEIQAGYFQQVGSSSDYVSPHVEPTMHILHDTFPSFAARHDEDVVYDTTVFQGDDFSNYGDVDYDTYTMLLASVQTPLFEGCDKTVLGTIIEQMHLKVNNRWSNKSFDEMLRSWKKVLPPGNLLPNSYYKCKRILKSLGLGYNKIHACKNNCMLFYKDDIERQSCRICHESRWEECSASMKKPKPVKVLRHFPLIPRLKRLYMSAHTSKEMRWHAEVRKDDDTLRHPADDEAWKFFDRSFPDFAADVRNVRLGLATDGFNPFGNMNLSYSICPVMVVAYNLPPWMCMKKEYNMLTLLIPGPQSPGKCLDVFLQPLIDELLMLWENGARTFDRNSGTSFMMRAALMWTISDFPGYGMLSSQATKGYYACPVCLSEVHSEWYAGKVCYLGHRRWLPADHEWRYDAAAFDGFQEFRMKPQEWSGDEILDKLNSFDFGQLSCDPRVPVPERPNDFLCWSHKSIFFDLPYWAKLILRNALDVMHIEKNVTDNIVGITLSIKGKNKDTPKARENLQELKIRRRLWPKKVGSTIKYPIAPFTIRPNLKKKVLLWFKGVKYPHGYAGNKIVGMKTHDCHVLVQRLLPVVIRPYLPHDVVEPIIALSRFFQKLCAKELKKSDVLMLKEDIVYILCKLERIFPPAFFTIMIHLLIHLPE
ncbi:uncharacterized protein LOC126803829 [Argentina anserina]|uniref:uncharacterized protein LOC126803829 n=1 Tax=Argentina anserina TaxID=57926 RepID=UPI0021761F03|nr:uncharacterized protein LOC126803829 [Potentilla anserina]